MKELILFSAALVFIFCQDLQSSNLPLKMKSKTEKITSFTEVAFENSACEVEPQDPTLDIVKELSASGNPGFYYREIVLKSEPQYDHLYCISGVSSDLDMEEAVGLAMAQDSSNETQTADQDQVQDSDLEAWKFLTDKWTITQKKEFCEDENRFKLNPACEDSIRLFEEQNDFNSDPDQSLAVL